MTFHETDNDPGPEFDALICSLKISPDPLTDAQVARRQSLLHDLVGEDSLGEAAPLSIRHDVKRRRRRIWRWGIPATAAASLAAALVVGAVVDRPQVAYATWSPIASPVDPAVARTAEAACKAAIPQRKTEEDASVKAGESDFGFLGSGNPGDYRMVAAERRGDYINLSLASDKNFAGSAVEGGVWFSCLFDAAEPHQVRGSDGFVSNFAPGEPTNKISPSEIQGGGGGFDVGPEGGIGHDQGRVGSDVTGVVIHAAGRSVQATVARGWFVAWWPEATEHSWDNVTYDVTLRDGAVRRGVPADPTKMTAIGPELLGALRVKKVTGARYTSVNFDGAVGSDVVAVTVLYQGSRLRTTLIGGMFGAAVVDKPGRPDVPRFELTLRNGKVRVVTKAEQNGIRPPFAP